MEIKKSGVVFTKNNGSEILCGDCSFLYFKPIDNIGMSPIKIYSSIRQAKSEWEYWDLSPEYDEHKRIKSNESIRFLK